jgi:branched-chain amino acid transport system permease protein
MAVYSMATIGIVLIFRTSVTTNFAQGMIGALAAFLSSNLALYSGVPFPLAIIISALVTFVIGYAIDAGIIRQGKAVNPAGKQMITMGLMMIIYAVLPVIFITITSRVPSVTKFSYDNLYLFGTSLYITVHALVTVIIAIVTLSILFAALKFTPWGISLRATAANETTTQMMGVNTKLVTGVTWGISGVFVSIAACSTATSINSGMMGDIQIYGFLACVLGGLSSFFAPIIGCVLIALFLSFIAMFEARWAGLITFALVMLLILIRPNGLFGRRMVKKV